MKKVILILFIIFCSRSAVAQKPCEKDPIYNQFDYWVGEWDVYGLKGNLSGYSKISKILDNCVVLEEWTSVGAPQGVTFTGKSFNSYNSATKQWQQNWVDSAGGSNEYLTGSFENNAMHFKSRPFANNGKTSVRTITFFKLANGYVRQLGEISNDDGKTCTTEYDLEYRPKNK